jgi:hypothetical protein
MPTCRVFAKIFSASMRRAVAGFRAAQICAMSTRPTIAEFPQIPRARILTPR